ncbi:hypothetical protein M422DRAFT_251486 [Sphaerobolus stellatus SS14]|uniref:C2H2-type domain-containing protein n=1 Tax=Sphaerobolus stellatus (strain SS14) TaxID=990650 RepID=A0A0C9VS63_SPHS4|nr:hypothetical protein M422DRAFT_251486 [Sphaerobolus stellatus SS14]
MPVRNGMESPIDISVYYTLSSPTKSSLSESVDRTIDDSNLFPIFSNFGRQNFTVACIAPETNNSVGAVQNGNTNVESESASVEEADKPYSTSLLSTPKGPSQTEAVGEAVQHLNGNANSAWQDHTSHPMPARYSRLSKEQLPPQSYKLVFKHLQPLSEDPNGTHQCLYAIRDNSICRRSFSLKREAKDHVFEAHFKKNTKFECCGRLFTEEKYIWQHIGIDPFIDFSARSTLRRLASTTSDSTLDSTVDSNLSFPIFSDFGQNNSVAFDFNLATQCLGVEISKGEAVQKVNTNAIQEDGQRTSLSHAMPEARIVERAVQLCNINAENSAQDYISHPTHTRYCRLRKKQLPPNSYDLFFKHIHPLSDDPDGAHQCLYAICENSICRWSFGLKSEAKDHVAEHHFKKNTKFECMGDYSQKRATYDSICLGLMGFLLYRNLIEQ